jgi:hypothetical protein
MGIYFLNIYTDAKMQTVPYWKGGDMYTQYKTESLISIW